MSLNKATKKYDRVEATLKEKAKLIIDQDFINKVHYMHKRVGSIEWSGLLAFETVSGSISDPANLVIKVVDFLPMDVGSSSYTEYDFDASDMEMQEFMLNAAEKGHKIGHIHTHHSMSCFFSGTDKGELHENSEHHNYYLSLIVNFKEPDAWCAKIGIQGEETHKGWREIKGDVKVTKSYKGEKKTEVIEKDVDLSEKEIIDTVIKYLYIIDMDLELTTSAKEHSERVTRLLTKKGSQVNTSNTGIQIRNWTPPGAPASESIELELPFDNAAIDINDLAEADIDPSVQRDPLSFTPAKVKPFLVKLLMNDTNSTATLEDAMVKFINASDINAEIDRIIENFEKVLETHFQMVTDDADYHCTAVAAIDLLNMFKTSKFVRDLIDEIDTNFIAPKSLISPKFTELQTGIKYEY